MFLTVCLLNCFVTWFRHNVFMCMCVCFYCCCCFYNNREKQLTTTKTCNALKRATCCPLARKQATAAATIVEREENLEGKGKRVLPMVCLDVLMCYAYGQTLTELPARRHWTANMLMNVSTLLHSIYSKIQCVLATLNKKLHLSTKNNEICHMYLFKYMWTS